MAEHLARVIFTEQDRVNCPFYWKIGACRHGDQCSRAHHKPSASQTVIIYHLYQNPPVAIAISEGQEVPDEIADQASDHFEAFFEEVFMEVCKFGELEDLIVCDNIGDHMIGNVYVKFIDEDDAEKALEGLRGRFYGGRPIEAEHSPVTDFKESRCRQYIEGRCPRGGYCNFMHIKHVPRSLKKKLFKRMYDENPQFRDRKKLPKSRSKSPPRDRDRDREAHRDKVPNRDNRNGRDNDRDREGEGGGDGRGDRPKELSRPRPTREDEEEEGRRRARQTSTERRAMIAAWNAENEEAVDGNE
eukprot:GHVR01150693.1.p1 GENE.GHVR01150693.1~~GHVR01150693.1.p1  ORF type:complete len:301 (-),score=69.52 GHVR01150693.1:286-1188(-)